jgi:hypothetical protein
MNSQHFDLITRTLGRATARRRLIAALALSPVAVVVAAHTSDSGAAKKRRKKKGKKGKKPQPNAFGCLDVGDACESATQCCSNICEGKHGKRKCQAHDSGECSSGAHHEECGGTTVACTTSFLEPGVCGTTTGNAGYCFAAGECRACTSDVECQELDGGQLGPSAACILCADCQETGGTSCVGPFSLPA